jgi:hypothetical protein
MYIDCTFSDCCFISTIARELTAAGRRPTNHRSGQDIAPGACLSLQDNRSSPNRGSNVKMFALNVDDFKV